MKLDGWDLARSGAVLAVSLIALGHLNHGSSHATEAAILTAPAAVTSPTTAYASPLAYPSTVTLPTQLAEAIGMARASTESACPHHMATAWAEIDEAGTVQGVHSACVDQG